MGFWQHPAFSKFMRLLHTYSSMLVLVLMLFFALTGITLNHPMLINSKAGQESRQETLDLPAHLQYSELPEDEAEQEKIAAQFFNWLVKEHDVKAAVFNYQFDPDEMMLELDFKRPAGYAIVEVDFTESVAELETEFAGYIALVNELHRGRNAGLSWIILIDITAISCIIFALSGFYLVLRQPTRRSAGNTFALLGIFLAVFAYIFSLH